MSQGSEIHSISKRVDSLEEDMKSLTKSVGGLEADVSNIKDSIHTINSGIREISLRLDGIGKTNWGVLAAWASAVIMVMSIIGTLALDPITNTLTDMTTLRRRMWDSIERNQIDIHKHKTGYGHKTIEVLLNSMDKRLDILESKANQSHK